MLQNRLSLLRFFGGEESPDSTEQRTGEEPGLAERREQKVPQKITVPAYVGVRVKTGGKSSR